MSAEDMTTVAAVGSALKVFPSCFEIIERIADVISVAKDNDTRCSHILGQANVIKRILEDLERMTLSPAVTEAIEFVCAKLKRCDDYMDELFDRRFSRTRDFVHGRQNNRILIGLMNEVDSAVGTLNAAINTQSLGQQQGIRYPSAQERQKTTGILPGKPTNLVILKRAHDRLKLGWRPPDENAKAVSHYEVHYRRRWQKWEEYKCGKITRTQLVVTGLRADTKYWFRVRALNNNGYEGRFNKEIPTETKFGILARGFVATGAAIGGTLAAPIVFGAMVGAVAVDSIEKKEYGEAAIAAGIGPVAVFGTMLMPPAFGVMLAVATFSFLGSDEFNNEDDY